MLTHARKGESVLKEVLMHANFEIDDDLIKEAMRSFDASTEQAAVEAALKLALKIKGQTEARKLRGTLQWMGNLEESRLSRF